MIGCSIFSYKCSNRLLFDFQEAADLAEKAMNKLEAMQILEISFAQKNDLQQIKHAYRKLSQRHHPDKGGDGQLMAQINEAYQLLGTADTASWSLSPLSQQTLNNVLTFMLANYWTYCSYSLALERLRRLYA